MYCSRCGAQLVPDAAFCAKCGAAVVPPPAPAPTPQTPPPPGFPPPAPPIFATQSPASTPVVIRRPGIVTVLAVLNFIGGAFWLLAGLGALAGNLGDASGDIVSALLTAPIFLALAAAQITCGFGLLQLKPYGRTLQLAFAWIGLLGIPIGTVMSILILIYLFKPGIKLIFAGRPGDDFTDQEAAEIRNDTASSGATTVIIIVVAVLFAIMVMAIIAAIAVPGLMRARTAGNEAMAIASLRAIHSAEVTYSSTCGQGGYAVSLEDLGKSPQSGGSAFLTADLAQSGIHKSGYVFTVTRDRSPITGDVSTAAATCNGSTGQPASSYFASAEPVTEGATGTRYFAVDARGTIYESAHAISNPIMNSTGITPIR